MRDHWSAQYGLQVELREFVTPAAEGSWMRGNEGRPALFVERRGSATAPIAGLFVGSRRR